MPPPPPRTTRTQTSAPTTRAKFHMRHLQRPRQTLHRALARRPCSLPLLVLVVLICIMVAFWGATVAAFYRPDSVNTWINLVIIAAMLTLACVGQALYCVWDKREQRRRAETEAQLEMARERGRMEGRREAVAAAAAAAAAAATTA